MRPFITTIYAAALLALAAVPCAAQPADPELQAARAAERMESLRLEQEMAAPTQPVSVSVTEVAEPAPAEQSPAGESAAPAPKSASAGTAVRASGGERTERVSAGDRPPGIGAEVTEKAARKAAASPKLSGRPDKVAMMFGDEKRGRTDEKRPGSVGTVLATILKLGAVLILAYLTILALKCFSTRRDTAPSGNRQFRMVDTFRFNSTSSLHLVEVRGKTLLLGCSSGQVNVLREFDGEQSPEDASEAPGKFAEYLSKYSDMSRGSGPSGRIAGMLRDCTSYLRDRCQGVRTGVSDGK